MSELQNDDCCLTCQFGEPKNLNKWGNPEYIKCKLKDDDMSVDDICENHN